MSDPLRNHRDIVALASARVDRRVAAVEAAAYRRGWGCVISEADRLVWLDAELDLLLDPAEPDLDALSRILAARVGLVVGATAPEWRQSHEEKWPLWMLIDPTGGICAFYDTDGRYPYGHFEVRVHCAVPGISTLTYPTDALFAALNATRPA
jgi:hypothetical protein